MGYLNQVEKTAEAIDDDGWLHSGDIIKRDKDGFYFITGRIKGLDLNMILIVLYVMLSVVNITTIIIMDDILSKNKTNATFAFYIY